MAAAAARAGVSAANRAVHIKISPQTLNLFESSEVLRVLKQYGQVVSFRNFALIPPFHASHTILAVFQDAQSANNLKRVSPLRFSIREPPPPTPKFVTSPGSFAPDYLGTPRQDQPTVDTAKEQSPGESTQPSTSEDTESPQSSPRERSFLLTVSASRQSHVDHVRRQVPYWGYPNRGTSFAREDLERQGSGLPTAGIADFDPWTNELPQHVVDEYSRQVKNRQVQRLGWFRGEDVELAQLEKERGREEKAKRATHPAKRRIASKNNKLAAVVERDSLKTPRGDKKILDSLGDVDQDVQRSSTNANASRWGTFAQRGNGDGHSRKTRSEDGAT